MEFSFLLESDRDWKTAIRNPGCFVMTGLKKQRAEVNVKRATKDELRQISEAKGKEVDEFLKERVVRAATEGEIKDMKPEDVMKMRFVVTWKVDPATGGKRAKARLVTLGFQDPFLGKEKTLAPTMNKRTRTLQLQLAVQNG